MNKELNLCCDGFMIRWDENDIDRIERFFEYLDSNIEKYIYKSELCQKGELNQKIHNYHFKYSDGNKGVAKLGDIIKLKSNHVIVYSNITSDFYLIDIRKLPYVYK